MSMVMAHAPVILPAVAGVKLRFSAASTRRWRCCTCRCAWRLLGDRAWAPCSTPRRCCSLPSPPSAPSLSGDADTADVSPKDCTMTDTVPVCRSPNARRPARTRTLGPVGAGLPPLLPAGRRIGALSVPMWALQFAGWLPAAGLRGPLWHAHEMLFGYTLAVLVGFLFTAGRNWSGQPTPTGRRAAGAGSAVAGRAGAGAVTLAAGRPAGQRGVPLGGRLVLPGPRAGGRRQPRNYFFVGLLVLLAPAGQAAVHASQLWPAAAAHMRSRCRPAWTWCCSS
jgi:hypothetical protein